MDRNQVTDNRPKVGVSGCLIGAMVRFDGGHARDRFVSEFLGAHFQWIPVCPEVGMGMDTPRETIRLVGDAASPRLVGNKTGTDYTGAMTEFSQSFFERFELQKPHGFILKKKSPSCGMERVQLYDKKGNRTGKRDGLFAAALKRAFPLMPIEEEGRLNDMHLRESFIQRVFVYKRWCEINEAGIKPDDLIHFHTRHKLLLMAHDPEVMAALGRLVAKAGKGDIASIAAAYGRRFMASLEKRPRNGNHANVLYHLLGFIKDKLKPEDKKELIHYIECYRRAEIPLKAPLILLGHHLRKIGSSWQAIETYLEPYPKAFTMRYVV